MNQLAITGVATSFFVHGFLVASVMGYVSIGGGDGVEPPKLKMVTIEASLAYKSQDAPKQPQKQRRAPRPQAEPEGVSRDADKKVEPKPDKPEERDVDFEKQFEKFKDQRQNDDDDVEIGDEAPRPGGAFDGSEHGFAEVSKGDPYMQELAAQMFQAWNLPTLEKGKGTAVGCVRLHPDGHVVDTKLWTPSENSNIDRSVKLALQELQKARKPPDLKPVPRHLIDITTQWTCFNFTP